MSWVVEMVMMMIVVMMREINKNSEEGTTVLILFPTLVAEKLLSRTIPPSCLQTYLGSISCMSGSLRTLNGYEVAGGN